MKIYEDKIWSGLDVQKVCIRHELYTLGDNEAFRAMLTTVDHKKPTTKNIYLVAKDIKEHSRNNTIENIMYILSKEAVSRFYDIAE